MKDYIIKRCDTNQFYKWRSNPYSHRWVDDPGKAKRYGRRGNAANAITGMRKPWSSWNRSEANELESVPMKVIEYEMQPTGISWEYLP